MNPRTQKLRALLARDQMLTMPCCHDALSARIIERAGFPMTFMSGFAVSANRLAMPDTGLISFGEMVGQLRLLDVHRTEERDYFALDAGIHKRAEAGLLYLFDYRLYLGLVGPGFHYYYHRKCS